MRHRRRSRPSPSRASNASAENPSSSQKSRSRSRSTSATRRKQHEDASESVEYAADEVQSVERFENVKKNSFSLFLFVVESAIVKITMKFFKLRRIVLKFI